MADGADARDAAGERPLPPPRPRMSNETPAPVPRLARPTGAARTARVLWAASFVAGALVIAIAVIRRTTQFQDLQKYVAGLAPDASSSTVETASAIAFWGALAALAIFTVGEALLRPATERRRGARIAMALVLLLHAALAVVAAPFVALGPGAMYTNPLLALQILLAAAGLIAGTLAARRARREEEPAVLRH